MQSQSSETYDFFFYGTLLVPAILIRVLGHDCRYLTFQDAVLPQYERHCVKGEDYPAVIKVVSRPEHGSTADDVSTRGTLVKGLSFADLQALDVFEGDQYTRQTLDIETHSPPSGITNLPKSLADPSSRKTVKEEEEEGWEKVEGGHQVEDAKAWVYVWSSGPADLEDEVWDFATFLKDKAAVWSGTSTTEYDEVERHHALTSRPNSQADRHSTREESKTTDADLVGKVSEGHPDFGKGMLKYWKFADGYVNLNHGSYGSPPKPVIDGMRKLSDQIESNPDLFMRRSWLPLLNKVRSQVAGLIGAGEDEVVIVPNATHGINTIVNNIKWVEGDIIVIYTITYGAVAQMIKHVCDTHPVTIQVINLTFPCTHSEILEQTEEMLERYNHVVRSNDTGEIEPSGKKADERVRMVVVDSIASNPGVIYPWEEIVKTCKKYGVLSLVDAAHSIGQVKTNVKKSDPDFWVSNCHKWLMSHRGGSVMYVPIRNQHLIRSTFPTSADYESSKYPTVGIDRPWSFVRQYTWTGTTDWTPFMSISTAIEFRQSIGGEDRIMRYCHDLAVKGGKSLAERFGTKVMENDNAENDGELTAAMVNIELPNTPDPKDLVEQYQQLRYFEDELFAANTFVAVYRHAGKWWCRCSAQVWSELSDFDYVGGVLEGICDGIRRGKHLLAGLPESLVVEGAEDLPTHDE